MNKRKKELQLLEHLHSATPQENLQALISDAGPKSHKFLNALIMHDMQSFSQDIY